MCFTWESLIKLNASCNAENCRILGEISGVLVVAKFLYKAGLLKNAPRLNVSCAHFDIHDKTSGTTLPRPFRFVSNPVILGRRLASLLNEKQRIRWQAI